MAGFRQRAINRCGGVRAGIHLATARQWAEHAAEAASSPAAGNNVLRQAGFEHQVAMRGSGWSVLGRLGQAQCCWPPAWCRSSQEEDRQRVEYDAAEDAGYLQKNSRCVTGHGPTLADPGAGNLAGGEAVASRPPGSVDNAGPATTRLPRWHAISSPREGFPAWSARCPDAGIARPPGERLRMASRNIA